MTQSTVFPCVCTSVRKVSRQLARVYDQALAPAGINVTQLATMRAIRRNAGIPMSRIAAELTMDRTTFYRAVAALERSSLVKINDSRKGRMRTVTITKLGDAVLGKADPAWDDIQNKVIQCFGEETYLKFLGAIERLEGCIP